MAAKITLNTFANKDVLPTEMAEAIERMVLRLIRKNLYRSEKETRRGMVKGEILHRVRVKIECEIDDDNY